MRILHAKTQFEQALALQQVGNVAAAQAIYETLLQHDPNNASVLINLASIYSAQQNDAEASVLLQHAITSDPSEPYAHGAYGQILLRQHRHSEAEEHFRRAITLAPDVAFFHSQRGLALYALQRFEDALADQDRAIALKPDYADAHNNRGNVLAHMKRQTEALQSYEQACNFNSQNAVFWCNRGAMLHHFRRDGDALECYQQAIGLQPTYLEAFINCGTLLGDMRQFPDAIASFDYATTLQPDAADAHCNKALLLLLLGHFEQGWPLYEWRWKKPTFQAKLRHYTQPLWLGGTPIAGKAILIHPEQGLGDYIQFSRYALELQRRGAKVILEAPTPLASLLATLHPDITIIMTGSPLPDFDLHCPIMSLPLACGTTVATIPHPDAYLSADETKIRQWETMLGEKTKPRIGLVWSGSPTHINDHNRSMPLAALAPLWDLPCTFYSLQTEIREDDVPQLTNVQTPLQNQHDFADTAALIAAMDVVICVDTAVAHVAGALGKKTWLLVPHVPDFRWLLDREDSPWYSKLRLFRQAAHGDWATVVQRVKETIMQEFAHV